MTPSFIEAELRDAVRTLRSMPHAVRAPLLARWPSVVHETIEAYGWNRAEYRRVPPTGEQIDRMDKALLWLWGLTAHDYVLIWGRANHVRWRVLSAEFHLGITQTKKRYRAALLALCERLTKGQANELSRNRVSHGRRHGAVPVRLADR